MGSYYYCALVFLLIGCTWFDSRKPEDSTVEYPALKARYDDLVQLADWKEGIPSFEDCDGALWAGVASMGGVDVNLSKFEYTHITCP